MNTLEILKAGRQLISKPEHWTQHVSARDRQNHSTSVYSPEACSFCSLGALMRMENFGDTYAADCALSEAMKGDITEFNDTSDHASVLAAWDRAIAKLEQK